LESGTYAEQPPGFGNNIIIFRCVTKITPEGQARNKRVSRYCRATQDENPKIKIS
jgi:hypothetical protein